MLRAAADRQIIEAIIGTSRISQAGIKAQIKVRIKEITEVLQEPALVSADR
jgi:hypothetical protein